MGENKAYSAKIEYLFKNCNVIDEKETKELISNTLKNIAFQISKSLGPYGSTTIIEDRMGEHYMTKDGYEILKAMKYEYPVSKTVLDIVKKISRTLVRTVGDGSTSSVIVAQKLFDYLNKLEKDITNISSQDLLKIMNIIAELLKKEIIKNSYKVDDKNFYDTIKKIATISNNNDSEIGKLFADIFSEIGKFGFINLELSKNSKDHFEKTQGIEVHRGWINQRMCNDSNDKLGFIHDDCFVFMCNDTLTDEEMDYVGGLIENICIKSNSPLCIIAPNYSSSFKSFFDINLQRKKDLKLIAIDYNYSSKEGKDEFEDLSIALDCKYYDKFNNELDGKPLNEENFSMENLGFCKKIKGNDLRTVFIDGIGVTSVSNKLIDRNKLLEEEYDKIFNLKDSEDHSKQLFELRKRIATLNNCMATLYVGGDSEIEKNTRKFLMEDAVFACKSSIEYGYIVGGNLIIPKIINKKLDKLVNKLIKNKELSYLKLSYNDYKNILIYISESFSYAFRTVLENAKLNNIDEIMNKCISSDLIYNIKNREFEKVKNSKVINSAETDIRILESSISIIGLLATSNQFITANPLSNR